MKTLKDVKAGETTAVVQLHGEGPVKRRIMAYTLEEMVSRSYLVKE